MANISLNVDSVLNAARKMEDAATRIDASLGRIDAIMSDLNAVWSDKNSKEYLLRYEQIKEEDFPAFKEATRNYGAFLNAVVETYKKEYLEKQD